MRISDRTDLTPEQRDQLRLAMARQGWASYDGRWYQDPTRWCAFPGCRWTIPHYVRSTRKYCGSHADVNTRLREARRAEG